MQTFIQKSMTGILVCFLMLPLHSAALAAPFAYVPNAGSNDVSVLDLATNTVVTTIPVGTGPQGVAVSPAGTRVYVTNYASSDVSVIDTASNSAVATIPIGPAPSPGLLGIAINPAGTRAYVADSISGHVTVIDTITNAVVGSVISGSLPYGVAVHPSGARVYVTNSGEDTVSVIDPSTHSVLTRIPVRHQPYGIAVNPAGTRVYVANYGDSPQSKVSVIDTATNTVIQEVDVAHPFTSSSAPMGVSVHPDGTSVYVTNYVGGYVAVIDSVNNVWTDTITVGDQPVGVSLNSDGSRLYVAVKGTSSVSVIDTAAKTVLTTVPVGTSPFAFGQFVAQGVLWKGPVSFSLKFTYPGTEDARGNIKFQSLTQTFTGMVELFEDGFAWKQVTFMSNDGKTGGYFRTISSVMTDTSGGSESLLIIGTGDCSSSMTGEQETGIAYIDAKGTLKKDKTGTITSISFSGKIAGGVGQATVLSGTFRATLTR